MSEARDLIETAVRDARGELIDLDERRERLVKTIADLERALRALSDGTGAEVPTRDERRHSGKYRKLFEYLARHNPEVIRLSFADVEEIVGMPLPPSSRRHLPHWYGYEGSAVARAIRDAGWKARAVDLEAETLEFWPDELLPSNDPAW